MINFMIGIQLAIAHNKLENNGLRLNNSNLWPQAQGKNFIYSYIEKKRYLCILNLCIFKYFKNMFEMEWIVIDGI